ncbi:hypothetical protein GBAR_LOCUS20505 [Geodia barretti]|uniref:CCHC-type domain-containing protein n=1 Tax=Geodia barretti TaxID=519541 RepID=A0AA35SW00_GEOBA|nr:hypothetical protein GBAR_LOCUS20505 [Geodia barretti]
MELRQKRFVYEKAFSVERIIQNLKTYQVATGEAELSVLCKSKHVSERRQIKRSREEEGSEVNEGSFGSTERGASTSQVGTSSSLGLLAVQYSSSEGEEVSSPHSKIATSEALPVPDAILGMYVGEEEGVRGEECGEEGGGDETRAYSELGFFESQESPGEGDDGVKRKTITSATSLVKESPKKEKWDEVKAKWKFPVSKLQTYVCANCGKVGHFTQDCTVEAAQKEPLRIPTDLKALYSKSVHCDGRGHITAHLLSHPTHNCLYSSKLKKVIKCSNSMCQTVSIYDLYICSQCLGNAFSQHYSMVTACWSSAGLRKIQNAIACEDHFHWHRVNCPSSAEENFVTRDKLQQATLSEFYF